MVQTDETISLQKREKVAYKDHFPWFLQGREPGTFGDAFFLRYTLSESRTVGREDLQQLGNSSNYLIITISIVFFRNKDERFRS